MITSFLGELGDNPENIFKISRKKILFIFCIFVLYKVISISLDLTFKYLQIALQIIFVGFQVECVQIMNHNGVPEGDPRGVTLNCKYIFK